MVKVAVIGCGYWGPNLIRNLVSLKGVELVSLCDLDKEKLKKQKAKYPRVKLTTRSEEVLKANNGVEAIIIATPPQTHFPLAKKALSHGKHVLVEKPLASSSQEAQELVDLAKKKKKILMVDHEFLYNAGVRKVKEYIDKRALGKIYYISSRRLNFGMVRSDVNALWNFGPHDISVVLYLLETEPCKVASWGSTFLQKKIEDVVTLRLDFPRKISVLIQSSWLSPKKIRELLIIGSKKMIVFDDTNPEMGLQIYNHGIEKVPQKYPHLQFKTLAGFQLLTRAGDVVIPKVDYQEPLYAVCQNFIKSIKTGKKPLTDGEHGLRVVKILEVAQKSLEEDGKPMEI